MDVLSSITNNRSPRGDHSRSPSAMLRQSPLPRVQVVTVAANHRQRLAGDGQYLQEHPPSLWRHAREQVGIERVRVQQAAPGAVGVDTPQARDVGAPSVQHIKQVATVRRHCASMKPFAMQATIRCLAATTLPPRALECRSPRRKGEYADHCPTPPRGHRRRLSRSPAERIAAPGSRAARQSIQVTAGVVEYAGPLRTEPGAWRCNSVTSPATACGMDRSWRNGANDSHNDLVRALNPVPKQQRPPARRELSTASRPDRRQATSSGHTVHRASDGRESSRPRSLRAQARARPPPRNVCPAKRRSTATRSARASRLRRDRRAKARARQRSQPHRARALPTAAPTLTPPRDYNSAHPAAGKSSLAFRGRAVPIRPRPGRGCTLQLRDHAIHDLIEPLTERAA